MKKHNWQQIIDKIKNSKNILLTTHVNPDGDAIGSEAAIYYCLKKSNKSPIILNSSPLPHEYNFLNEQNIFNHYNSEYHADIMNDVDLAIVLDIGSIDRLGEVGECVEKSNIPTICIDHHPIRTTKFDLEIVDVKASATAYLIYEFIKIAYPDFFDVKIAEALYTGILTDTGSFRFENTDSQTMAMAAELIKMGAKPGQIYRNIYENVLPEQAKLMALVMQDIQYLNDGKLAWFSITREHLKQANANIHDIKGFTDFVRSIKKVEVAMKFLEKDEQETCLNFRSKGNVVINQLAKELGGGGHSFAAGAVINRSLQETIDFVLPKVQKLIDEYK